MCISQKVNERFYDAKPLVIYFYVRAKMPLNFHACISVPLGSKYLSNKMLHEDDMPMYEILYWSNSFSNCFDFKCIWIFANLQWLTRHLGVTLVFVGNGAERQGFNFWFSRVFCQYWQNFPLGWEAGLCVIS